VDVLWVNARAHRTACLVATHDESAARHVDTVFRIDEERVA
jgi:hypothetical protein